MNDLPSQAHPLHSPQQQLEVQTQAAPRPQDVVVAVAVVVVDLHEGFVDQVADVDPKVVASQPYPQS